MSSSKNNTSVRVLVIICIWVVSLFLFLEQSKKERSLIFAKIGGLGWISELDSIHVPIKKDTIQPIKNITAVYSLKRFAPQVGNQGNLGSCTSWASAYAGFTIVKRIEAGANNTPPFSPLNLYIRVKYHSKESPCSDGASIYSCLELLKSEGCESFSSFTNSCDAQVIPIIQDYKEKLADFTEISITVPNIKQAIYHNYPVVFGINCYSGTDWKDSYSTGHGNFVWNGYYSGIKNSGHAMCVVGYDDLKEGGVFEIINSWGEDFANHGFFWIKYGDFIKHVQNCYALVPQIDNAKKVL